MAIRLGLVAKCLAVGIAIGFVGLGHLSVGVAQPLSVFANFDDYDTVYVGTCQDGQGGGCDRFTALEAADLSADGGTIVGTDFSNDPDQAFGFGGPHAVVWLPNPDSGNGPHQVVPLPITPADIHDQAEIPASF